MKQLKLVSKIASIAFTDRFTVSMVRPRSSLSSNEKSFLPA